MISYARVCIEIKANQLLCESVEVLLDDSTARSIKVDYEWKPVSCMKCGTFGHKCPVTNTDRFDVQTTPAAVENLSPQPQGV